MPVPILTLHQLDQPPVVTSGTSISLTRSIELGDTLTIRTKIPLDELPSLGEMWVDKWVTLDHKGERLFLGRVTSVTSGKLTDVEGAYPKTRDVTIRCKSWWCLLEQSSLVPAPAEAVDALPGFILKFDEWGDTLDALFSVVRAEGPGYVLEQLFGLWAKMRVPNSITGNAQISPALNDNIDVLWEGPNQVEGFALNAIGNSMLDSTPAAMLTGTFKGDPRLIEFFDTPSSLVYRIKPFLQEDVDGAELLGGVNNYELTWRDDKRINAHFVTTALTTSSRFGDWGLLGGPIIETESVQRDGLRIDDHVWPFFPNARDSNFKLEADRLIGRAEAMYRDNHLFADGSANDFALDTSIEPGTWKKLDDGLVFYVTDVTHTWSLMQGGTGAGVVRHERTSLRFTRARFGGYRHLPPQSPFEAPYTTLPTERIA